MSDSKLARRKRWKAGLKYPVPCVYCGAGLTPETVTVDHIIPVSKGGYCGPRNYAPACKGCNNDKGNAVPCATRKMLTKALARVCILKKKKKQSSKLKPQKVGARKPIRDINWEQV